MLRLQHGGANTQPPEWPEPPWGYGPPVKALGREGMPVRLVGYLLDARSDTREERLPYSE